MSESPVCGVFAHRLVGSEGSGGGDDLGEVGLERIGLHREAECNVDEVGATRRFRSGDTEQPGVGQRSEAVVGSV